MRVVLGLGSNLGNRLENLRFAVQELKKEVLSSVRISPVVESPAWLKDGAPPQWDRPFLNLVLEGEPLHSVEKTFELCQAIEQRAGREAHEVWSPRPLDIDILSWGQQSVQNENLVIPHAGVEERPFVLDPWIHLDPAFRFSDQDQTSLLKKRRKLQGARPLLMTAVNITPDSFSDGGLSYTEEDLDAHLQEILATEPSIIDLGGQSTRPQARIISADEEWERLERALRLLGETQKQVVRPWISIDTFRGELAARAIDWGAEIINDVSGLEDPLMLELAKSSSAQFVFMHHLGIPATPSRNLSADQDPVSYILNWAFEKLEHFDKLGIPASRLIFDPGIGYGKTAAHSLQLIRRAAEFKQLPVRILIGHSRKSYQARVDPSAHASREAITLAHSLHLARSGVEIIRVHDVRAHRSAFLADAHLGVQ